MADQTIGGLTDLDTGIVDTDEIAVWDADASTTKRCGRDDFFAALPIFVNTANNTYSRFGAAPSTVSVTDARDNLVIVKQSDAGSGPARACTVVNEVEPSSSSSQAAYGLNAQVDYDGTAALTQSNRWGGLCAGRYNIALHSTDTTLRTIAAISGITVDPCYHTGLPASVGITVTNATGIYIHTRSNLSKIKLTHYTGIYVGQNDGDSMTSITGIEVEAPTATATDKRGIWLNGDDKGSDLVLGAGEDVSIHWNNANLEFEFIAGDPYDVTGAPVTSTGFIPIAINGTVYKFLVAT